MNGRQKLTLLVAFQGFTHVKGDNTAQNASSRGNEEIKHLIHLPSPTLWENRGNIYSIAYYRFIVSVIVLYGGGLERNKSVIKNGADREKGRFSDL